MSSIYAVDRNGKLKTLEALFLGACMLPFIIPNPIAATNIQPYSVLLGLLVILWEALCQDNSNLHGKLGFVVVSWLTLFVAMIVLVFSGITISAFRALFNYCAVAIVPLAAYMVLCRIKTFPEKFVKALILFWFAVATVQFFVNRHFLTGIIAGANVSNSYRGVVGLASEPSFLGIACFYFLHMTRKFQKNKALFFVLILTMGIVYAQSMMGLMFIGAFLAVFLLDMANSKRGLYIWLISIAAVIVFIFLLNTVLVDTRLYELFERFQEGGVDSVLDDASAETRFNSVKDALAMSFGNYLLPLGFKARIGSGYGGFLCELGLFALPILWCISFVMTRTFKKTVCRVLYFVLITILLFNNTQIGNPLLLLVLAMNIADMSQESQQKTAGG